MGKEPDEIEREIEETRARMGERVDALTYKADVKSRVGDSIAEKRDKVTDKVKSFVSGGSDAAPGPADKVKGLMSKGGERVPSAEDVKHHARRAQGLVKENPLGLAVGAVAAGFLVGLLLPSTRMEDEKLGQAADTVKAKAAETGQEALERGKQVAQDVAQTATETAKQSASQHAGEMSETARQNASEAADEARSQVQS
jgi:ElaB/YqjD/DUF883 family membrane-anchored ribosome-binding protein